MAGCRIVRVHDVAGTVRVCRVIEAILSAAFEREPAP
jgi:dihydropteroate synthase